jgi:hypothetical protein
VYGLASALPVPGRGPWSQAVAARHGFDVLLCAGLFLPLRLQAGGAASFGAVAALPLLAFLCGAGARQRLGGRVLTRWSPHALLLSGFLWTLFQGPQESGLLLLLASLWALSLKESVAGLQSWELANGLAIMGASWLAGPTHLRPSLVVMAAGVLLSESLALASRRWRPDLTNSLFLMGLLALSSTARSSAELGLALLAGLLGGLRGLSSGSVALTGLGLLTFLRVADGQLQLAGADLKVRLLPLAALLIGSSLWLLLRPGQAIVKRLGFSPLASLRAGIALLALPPLLGLAAHADLSDFVWVLAVGCSSLALSPGFSGHPELRGHLKQAGGWVLSGWALVSLGRAALALPWQLATLVIGLILVGAGIKIEKNRKG